MNWTQLKMVIWLRWRLTLNQVARHGKFNLVVAIIGVIGIIGMALAAGVGGTFFGFMAMPGFRPGANMLFWDVLVLVFLFLWMISVLAEIQRSETIDLGRLLHLPVSLQGIFVINYIVSHVTFGLVLFLPAVLGVSVGLVFGKGILMVLMFPLVFTFVFMITAWTYCLRGWLVTLMVNPRKRRNIVLIITTAFILLTQLPNIYINVIMRHQRGGPFASNHSSSKNFLDSIPPGWIEAHNYVPFLWLPKGATALAQGNPLPATLGSLGAFLLGAAGLARAYRSTLRFYTGQQGGENVPAEPQALPSDGVPAPVRPNFIEKRVPFVSEDVAALSLAFLRSMLRAPEIRIALFTNVIVIVVLIGAAFSNVVKTRSGAFQLFSGTGAVAFTFFGLAQLIFNQFGYDRDGFRILVLSPSRRRDVLLAKNVALAPIVFTLGTIALVVMIFVTHLPVLGVLAGILQLGTLFLFLTMVGNFTSIWTPYRVSAGSLKPTKPPAKIILLVMLTQFCFPIAMLPAVLPTLLGILLERLDFGPARVIDAILSLGALGLAALFYYLSLEGLGNFLEKREQKILQVVSQEVE